MMIKTDKLRRAATDGGAFLLVAGLLLAMAAITLQWRDIRV